MTIHRPRARALRLLFPAVLVLACAEPPAEDAPRVAEVRRRDIVVSAVAAGAVEPITTVEVKSKASGEIVAVLAEEGDKVKVGQLLVRVDPRIPTNAVVQAEADSMVARAELDNAEAQLERSEALHESRAITDLELESARLARASAFATLIRTRRTLEDAKIALEDTEVRAPTHGVILGRAVEVGSVIQSASSNVGGGAILMRMATLDTVRVRAMVDETDIGMIQPGTPVTIQVASYPNRPFRGEVERIGAESVVQQNVTMFPVLTRIGNTDGLLRPGMNAEVQVHIGDVRDVLAVPNAALRTAADAAATAEFLGLNPEITELDPEDGGPVPAAAGDGPADARPRGDRERRPRLRTPGGDGGRRASLFGGEYVVFVLRDGTPSAVAVRTGLTDFDYTAVTAGLAEGDSVLLLPTTSLLADQQRRQEWARERAGSPLGGTR